MANFLEDHTHFVSMLFIAHFLARLPYNIRARGTAVFRVQMFAEVPFEFPVVEFPTRWIRGPGATLKREVHDGERSAALRIRITLRPAGIRGIRGYVRIFCATVSTIATRTSSAVCQRRSFCSRDPGSNTSTLQMSELSETSLRSSGSS